ncbi:MAG: 50S ribosomal protein L28 [Proteobacteria bacterium]|nr:50S ribosomal protein L28 [Pseudomonadota bacterium]
MPATCEICGKKTVFGHNVSHSNIKTRKISRPNLQRIRIKRNGRTYKAKVCTRCIRSGSVLKA